MRFSPAQEFSQTLPKFSLGYGGTDNTFYFFCKTISFRLNKEKDNVQSIYVYFNFFHETVTSQNMEAANNVAHAIFVLLHSAMKTHV